MLKEFPLAYLPGAPSSLPNLQSDTVTFDELYRVATEIFSKCVIKKEPLEMDSEAGWSYAGKSQV